MADQIAQDPAFPEMTRALQDSSAQGGGGGEGGPGGLSLQHMDQEKYAQAMSGVLQNPQFVQMAEKLGQQILSVRALLFAIELIRLRLYKKCFHARRGASLPDELQTESICTL